MDGLNNNKWLENLVLAALAALTWLSIFGSARSEENPDRIMRTAFPLAALNNVDPSDAKVASGHLLKEIVENHNVAFTAEVFEETADFFERLLDDKFDFFLVFGYDYLRLKDSYPMRPVLVGQDSEESPLDEFLFITAADCPSVAEAPPGKLLIQRGSGQLPMIWLDSVCAEQHTKPAAELYPETEVVETVADTLLPVFFGKAPACIITRGGYEIMAELNPQITKRVKILAKSKPLLATMLCFRPNYVEPEPGVVLKEGMAMSSTPKGQQLLTLFRTEKLVAFEPSFEENLKALLTKHASIQSSLAEPKTLAGQKTPDDEL